MLENFNTEYAGKTRKWTGTDKKSRFQKVSKKIPDNPSVKFYKDNPIDYSHNNYGFRTPDDFKFEKGNVFLGCSITYGIGVHIEDTWGYKLSKEVGGKFWNLGVGGTGIGTARRLLNDIEKVAKVENVFLYMAFPYRYEMYFPDDDTWQTWSPTVEGNPNEALSSNWFKRALIHEKNMLQYWHSNFDAIKWYCHKNKLPLYHLTGENARYTDNIYSTKLDINLNFTNQSITELFKNHHSQAKTINKTKAGLKFARDFLHPNVSSHNNIFEDFKKLLSGEKPNESDPNYKPEFLSKSIKKSII